MKPTVMLQSSGLGNSLNALTSLLLPYQIPALVLISMRGDAGEWNAAQVPMGRAVRPICDAIGLAVSVVDRPELTAAMVQLVGQTAFGTRLPGVCQLPRRITVPAQPEGTKA
jgi:sulfopyruvate decarboxylase TPP-binding subunit